MPTLLQQSYQIQSHNHNRRLFLAWVFFLFLACILLARLFSLQCIHGGEMYRRGQDNQLTLATLPPHRGKIYDRNHKIIAENHAVFHLDIKLMQSSNIDETLDILVDMLPRTQKSRSIFKEKMKNSRKNSTIRYCEQLSEQERDILSLVLYKHPELQIVPEFRRYYPCGSACAPVSGYVKPHLAHSKRKIKPGQVYIPTYQGINGIEQYYQKSLHGKKGLQQLHRNAQGKVIFEDITLPALHGDDLVLTIDVRLQKMIAQRMGKLRGSAVMINPKNGEILALYSSPSYDPNIFLEPDAALQTLFNDPDKPLFNRAIAGLFPPASTIKPFLVLDALQSRIISPQYKIFDPGFFRYGDTEWVYHNWLKTGHGQVNPYKAILISNDTFFYHLSLLLGIDRISDMLSHWGFGTKTAIDIPGEKAGLLPTREWKENTGQSWLVGDTIITGIGQGATLSTPLQIAQATAVLSNKGKGFQPHILQAYEHPSGQPETIDSQPLPPVKVDQTYWSYVVDAMSKVTSEGTGKRFGVFAWPVAAKTGTAQVARHSGKDKKYAKKLQDHSIFTLFTPTTNPEVVLVVLLENNHNAILIARGIMDDFLSLKTQKAHYANH